MASELASASSGQEDLEEAIKNLKNVRYADEDTRCLDPPIIPNIGPFDVSTIEPFSKGIDHEQSPDEVSKMSNEEIKAHRDQSNSSDPILNDALAYLDQIKIKYFGRDDPNVYVQFLDIMKNFKAGVLDTSGVISNILTLFNGDTDLLTGFNAFLPPGYRIEIKNDCETPVRASSPMGTILHPAPLLSLDTTKKRPPTERDDRDEAAQDQESKRRSKRIRRELF